MPTVDYMLFDLNSYFASCEQQDNPHLRGKPLAVVPMLTDSTSVLAASIQAKRRGIKTGTKVRDAKRLCPDIQFVTTHHTKYLDYHEKILKAVDEIIPIDQVLSVDEVSCRLMGSQRELQNAIALSQKLKRHVQNQVGECLTSSIGLGPNSLIAKIASDLQKPDGLVWITQEEIPEKLGPLSIRTVPGIGEKTELHLNRLGIFKIQDILRLSTGEAKSKWGSILGSKVLQGLSGENYLHEHGATKSMGHEHVLEPDLRNNPGSFRVAMKLLNKACVRIRKNNLRCTILSLSVRFTNSEHFQNDVKFEATQDTGFLMKQLTLLWPKIFNARPFKVSVVLSGFQDTEAQQFSFFDKDLRRREKAYSIADQINEKLGKNSIFVADLQGLEQQARGGISFSRVPSKDEF